MPIEQRRPDVSGGREKHTTVEVQLSKRATPSPYDVAVDPRTPVTLSATQLNGRDGDNEPVAMMAEFTKRALPAGISIDQIRIIKGVWPYSASVTAARNIFELASPSPLACPALRLARRWRESLTPSSRV